MTEKRVNTDGRINIRGTPNPTTSKQDIRCDADPMTESGSLT